MDLFNDKRVGVFGVVINLIGWFENDALTLIVGTGSYDSLDFTFL